jgi:hypothetical protein
MDNASAGRLPQVYVETTIPSYLTARPAQQIERLRRQALTRLWWERRRHEFSLVVSQAVLDECGAGDPTFAAARLEALRGLPLLPSNPKAEALSIRLAAGLALPARAVEDAKHLAIAATHAVEYLLTWNCTHLANDALQRRLVRICAAAGCRAPLVCTPEWLMPQDG